MNDISNLSVQVLHDSCQYLVGISAASTSQLDFYATDGTNKFYKKRCDAAFVGKCLGNVADPVRNDKLRETFAQGYVELTNERTESNKAALRLTLGLPPHHNVILLEETPNGRSDVAQLVFGLARHCRQLEIDVRLLRGDETGRGCGLPLTAPGTAVSPHQPPRSAVNPHQMKRKRAKGLVFEEEEEKQDGDAKS